MHRFTLQELYHALSTEVKKSVYYFTMYRMLTGDTTYEKPSCRYNMAWLKVVPLDTATNSWRIFVYNLSLGLIYARYQPSACEFKMNNKAGKDLFVPVTWDPGEDFVNKITCYSWRAYGSIFEIILCVLLLWIHFLGVEGFTPWQIWPNLCWLWSGAEAERHSKIKSGFKIRVYWEAIMSS